MPVAVIWGIYVNSCGHYYLKLYKEIYILETFEHDLLRRIRTSNLHKAASCVQSHCNLTKQKQIKTQSKQY